MRSACAALLLATSSVAFAATPPSATLQANGPGLAWTGSAVAGGALNAPIALAPEALCQEGVTCDTFTLTLAGTAADWAGRSVHIHIGWLLPATDYDLYVHKDSNTGETVDSSAQGATTPTGPLTSEDADIDPNLTGTGVYTVHVVYYTATAGDSYSGTASIAAGPAPAPPPPPEPVPPAFAPRFSNFKPPNGMGNNQGEPSIGFSSKTGRIMYMAWTETLRAAFSDLASPAIASWDDKSFATTSLESNDAILFTDRVTGRTFVSQLIVGSKQSISAFTDDDGETWTVSQGSGINSGVDHQTIGGGPWHANGGVLGQSLTDYPHAVYYAAQDIALAEFASSQTGGLSYGPGVPMYTLANCEGIHGHIKVATDGTVYVPNADCADPSGERRQAVAVSTDNGLHWTVRTVPDTAPSTWDPSVGVGSDGTVYLGFGARDDTTAMVAVSHDQGASWSKPYDVGASHSLRKVAFPAVVAGDGDRAAIAFLGTRDRGIPLGSGFTFAGAWNLYVATTFDGGTTWTTVNATQGDPVQRGNICDAGTSCPLDPNTRNLLDFMDVVMDREGRIVVAYPDGCVSAECVAGVDRNGDGALNALDNDGTAIATVARQAGGRRLLAAFDPKVPAGPAPPRLVASLDGSVATLSWSTPDDGGSAITGYRVYKNGAPLAALGDVNTTTDAAALPASRYSVAARNAVGEGTRSQEVAPLVGESACKGAGLSVADDTADAAPNVPVVAQTDLRKVSIGEPYREGASELVITLKLGSGGALPPNSQWYVIWNRPRPDDVHDRSYVAMRTNSLGTPSFEYGRVSYPLAYTSPAPNQGNLPTWGGALVGTYDAQNGVVRFVVPRGIDGLEPGQTLLNVEGRAFLGRNDPLPINQNLSSDFTPAGSYTVIGNLACLEPPLAPTGLAAIARQREVALSWKDNSSDETGFLLERSTSPADSFVQLVELPAGATSFVDATVLKKTTYYYRVRAAKGPGRSAYSNVASAKVK